MSHLLGFNYFEHENWTKVFQTHICQTLESPESWDKCEPMIHNLNTLRSEFNFEHMNKQLTVDASWMVKLAKMENYIRIINFLSSRFKFGNSKASVQGFFSKWTGSLTNGNYQTSHIRFESINFTYNYAIINFDQAMGEIKDVSKAGDCIKRLRSAAWGISETMKYTGKLRGLMRLPFEFSDENLNYLHGVFTGLAYLCMFKHFEQNAEFSKDHQKMASLLKQVHTWLKKAKDIYEFSGEVRKYHKNFHPTILWHYYKYSYLAMHHCTLGQLEMHEKEVTKGHLGTAISYMSNIEIIMTVLDKDKNLSKDDKKDIQALYKQNNWAKIKKDSIDKNEQVYKFRIPNVGEVKAIIDWDRPLTDLAPVNVYVPPEGNVYYQQFMSEGLEKIDSNMKLYIQNKRQFQQKLYYDVNEKRNKVYKENNVDYILSSSSMQPLKLGDSFLDDLEHIKTLNGGLKGYDELIHEISKEKQGLDGLLASIDSRVEKTQNDDQEFFIKMSESSNGKPSLVDYVIFQQAAPELVGNILSIHQNFQQIKNTETTVIPEFENNKSWLAKLSDPGQDWKSYAQKNDAAAFIQSNKEQIDKVIKMEGLIRQISDATLKDYNELLEILNKFETNSFVSKIAMHEMTENDVYAELDRRTKEKFDQFDENCRKCITGLDKVAEKAKPLSGIKEYENKNDMTEILQAITFHKDIYSKFTDLLFGYFNLHTEAKKASDQLDYYMQKKEVERTNLIEDLERRQKELEEMNKAKQELADELAKQVLADELAKKISETPEPPAPSPADNPKKMVDSYTIPVDTQPNADFNFGLDQGNNAQNMGSHLFGQKSQVINNLVPQDTPDVDPLDTNFDTFGMKSGMTNPMNIQSTFFQPTDFTNNFQQNNIDPMANSNQSSHYVMPGIQGSDMMNDSLKDKIDQLNEQSIYSHQNSLEPNLQLNENPIPSNQHSKAKDAEDSLPQNNQSQNKVPEQPQPVPTPNNQVPNVAPKKTLKNNLLQDNSNNNKQPEVQPNPQQNVPVNPQQNVPVNPQYMNQPANNMNYNHGNQAYPNSQWNMNQQQANYGMNYNINQNLGPQPYGTQFHMQPYNQGTQMQPAPGEKIIHYANDGGPQPIMQDQQMYNYGTHRQPKISYNITWGNQNQQMGHQQNTTYPTWYNKNNQNQGGPQPNYANPYMNQQFPPWHDKNNPNKGPW